jgi:hypothetical protein
MLYYKPATPCSRQSEQRVIKESVSKVKKESGKEKRDIKSPIRGPKSY